MAVKPSAEPARSVLGGSEHGASLVQVEIAIRPLGRFSRKP